MSWSTAISRLGMPRSCPRRGDGAIDRPTVEVTSESVMSLLRELHKGGATICMVTHESRYAHQADRTIDLFDGRVVTEEPAVAQAVGI